MILTYLALAAVVTTCGLLLHDLFRGARSFSPGDEQSKLMLALGAAVAVAVCIAAPLVVKHPTSSDYLLGFAFVFGFVSWLGTVVAAFHLLMTEGLPSSRSLAIAAVLVPILAISYLFFSIGKRPEIFASRFRDVVQRGLRINDANTPMPSMPVLRGAHCVICTSNGTMYGKGVTNSDDWGTSIVPFAIEPAQVQYVVVVRESSRIVGHYRSYNSGGMSANLSGPSDAVEQELSASVVDIKAGTRVAKSEFVCTPPTSISIHEVSGQGPEVTKSGGGQPVEDQLELWLERLFR